MAITFKVGFTAETSDLARSLQSISREIDNAFSVRGGLSKEIQEATQSAMVLQKALSRATSDKGLSGLTLNSELRKAGTNAAHLTATLARGGEGFVNSLNAANIALAQSNRNAVTLNSHLKEAARVMVQSFKFTAAQQAIQVMTSGLEEAVRWAVDLNDAVNEIGVVTGKTGSDLEKIAQQSIKGSKELKVAAKEYAEGALIFYQQGLDDDEVTRRNEITIKAAKAAGQSVKEMSSQLTAIWNTYGMVGEEQERAASVGAKMAAQTAVDFSDIAEAMQTAAAPAAQMGVSYDSLAAIIATVGDTTQQSASVIGNAYKTIFSRFQQLKAEGTDGEVTLNRVSGQLRDLGVNALDSAGNLRPLGDMIHEVGEKWDSWSSKQQLAIAQLVGGTRQYGQFLALMNNYDKYLLNLQGAKMEDGSTLELQYAQATESIETYATTAAEAWKRAFEDVMDPDIIKGFYRGVENLGNVFGKMMDSIGGLPGILAISAGLMANKLVPAAVNFGVGIKDAFVNLTAGGRAKNINKEYQRSDDRLAQQAQMQGVSEAEKQSLELQRKKNEFGRQTAIINDKINTALRGATGAHKLNLEYLQQQIRSAQELYQTATDNLAALKRQADEEQRLARIEAERARNRRESAARNYNNRMAAHDQATANLSRLESDPSASSADIEAARATERTTAIELEAAAQDYIAAQRAFTEVGEANVEKMRTSLSGLNSTLSSFGSSSDTSLNQVKQSFNEALAAAKDFGVAEDDIKRIQNAIRNINREGLKNARNNFKQLAADLNVTNIDGDRVKATMQKLSQAIDQNDPSKIQAVQGELKEMLGNTEQAASGVERLTQQLLTDKTTALAQANAELREQIALVDTLDATERERTTNSRIEDEVLTQDQAQGRLNRSDPTNDPTSQFRPPDLASSIEGMASLASAATMAVSAVRLLNQAFSDPDASWGEKIMAGVTALSMILPALQMAGNGFKALGVVVDGTTVKFLGLQASMWQITLVVGLIAAAIGALIYLFTRERKAIEKNIEQNKELIESTNKLSEALDSSSESLQNNMDAWMEAKSTGEGVVKTYEDLTQSIQEMNKALSEAGIEQSRINEAQREALTTGKLDKYNELKKEAEIKTAGKNVQANMGNINSQKDLLVAEKGTGSARYVGYKDNLNEETLDIIQQYSDIAQENEFGEINIVVDYEGSTPAELKETYERLIAMKNAATANGADKSFISGLQKEIEALKPYVGEMAGSIDEVQKSLIELGSAEVANDSIEIANMGLKEQMAYLLQIKDQLTATYGDAFTPEQIDGMVSSITAGNQELQRAIELDQKLIGLSQQFAQRDTKVQETQAQLVDAQIANDSGALMENAFAKIREEESEWYLHRNDELNNYKKNHKEAYDQMIADVANATGKSKEELEKMNFDELKNEIKTFSKDSANNLKSVSDAAATAAEEAAKTQYESLLNFFNGLSADNQELLLSANLEFADDESELQEVLNNRYDLKMKIKAVIVTDDVHDQAIEKANKLQDVLGSAIDEYQDKKEIGLDTANAMIEAGYGQYLVEVNGKLKLTTAAQEDWNASLKAERNAVMGKIENLGSLLTNAQELAYAMGDLNATLDSPELQAFTQKLADQSVEFLNNKKAATDYGLTLDYIKGLQSEMENLDISSIGFEDGVTTDESIKQIASAYGEVGAQISNMMINSKQALESNKITMSEYNATIYEGAKAIQTSYEKTQEAISSKMAALQKEAGDIDLSKEVKNATPEVQKLKKQYDKLNGALEDSKEKASEFQEELESLKKFENYSKNLEKNFEQLAGVFEEDFTIKPDLKVEDLDTGQLTAIKDNLKSVFDNFFTEIDFAQDYNTALESMSATSTSIIEGMAQKLGTTSQEAYGIIQNLHAKAASGVTNMTQEELVQYAALTGAVVTENGEVINSVSGAVGTMIEGIGEIISNFDYHLKFEPTGEINIKMPGLGVLAGEALKSILSGGFNIPISMDGNLDLGITGEGGDAIQGGLNKIQKAGEFLKNSGLGDGIGLSDYSDATPTVADPKEFDPGDGTSGSPKGKKGGDDAIHEEEEQEPEKYHERYETLTESIERLTDAVEKYGDAADDAWGAAKIRNLERQEKAMQKLGREQVKLINQTREYAKADKKAFLENKETAALAKWGGRDQLELQNPEQIRKYWENQAKIAADAYNAVIKKYNGKKETDASKEAIDNAKKTYDKAIEAIEEEIAKLDQVLENEDLLRERINDQVDRIREWMEQKVERAKVKMELRIGISELDIEWMDTLIDLWGDSGKKIGKTWEGLKENIGSSANSLDAMMENTARMQQILTNIDPTNPQFQDDFIRDFGIDAWQEYLTGNGALPESVMSQIEDNIEGMIDEINNMKDSAEKMLQQYIEILELYLEDFDAIAEQISNQNDRLEMYSQLLEFSGQKYNPKSYSAVKDLAEASLSNAKTEVKRAKAALDLSAQAARETEEQLQSFYDDYGSDAESWSPAQTFVHDQLLNARNEARDALNEANGEFTSAIQDLTDAAAEAIEQMAEVIKMQVVDNLGGIFDSFEAMTEVYDQQYSLDHFFLEDYDKNYQLSDLLAQIDKQMENVTDPARLEEFKALIDEINAANEEGVQITQTDVDLLKAKFEMQKAQDAYEEAQAAKNTMRLARDASGNWNYIYSTDAESSSNAAEELANAQHNYEKLLHEARDEASELWMQAQQEFFEFQETIDWARYNQDEKYRQQIDYQYNYYMTTTERYAAQIAKYNEMLGDNFEDTSLGIITGFTSIEDAQKVYSEQHAAMNEQMNENTQEWGNVVKDTCIEMGIDYEDLEDIIRVETSEMIDENQALEDKIDDLKNRASEDLSEMNDRVSEWRADFVSQMDQAIAAVQELIDWLQRLRDAQMAEMEVGSYYDKGTDYTDYLHTDYAAYKQSGGDMDMGAWLDKYHRKDVLERMNAGEDRGIYSGATYEEAKKIIIDAFREGAEYIGNKGHNYGDTQSGKELTDWEAEKKKTDGKLATGGLVKSNGIYELAENAPELVLNPSDTRNILNAVHAMRGIVNAQIATAQGAMFGNLPQMAGKSDPTTVQQDVKIEASFPGVSVASEIEEAFNNLINQVAQYRIKK